MQDKISQIALFIFNSYDSNDLGTVIFGMSLDCGLRRSPASLEYFDNTTSPPKNIGPRRREYRLLLRNQIALSEGQDGRGCFLQYLSRTWREQLISVSPRLRSDGDPRSIVYY